MRRPIVDRKPERDLFFFFMGAWSFLVLQAVLAH